MAAWTRTDDVLLLEGVKKYGTMSWSRVASSMLSHKYTHLECKDRFYKLIESRHWSVAEDEKLNGLVENLGSTHMWATISLAMNRPSTSCYARHLFLSNERMTPRPLPNFKNKDVSVIPQSRNRKHLIAMPVEASQPKVGGQSKKRKAEQENEIIPLGFVPKALKKREHEGGRKLKLDLET